MFRHPNTTSENMMRNRSLMPIYLFHLLAKVSVENELMTPKIVANMRIVLVSICLNLYLYSQAPIIPQILPITPSIAYSNCVTPQTLR